MLRTNHVFRGLIYEQKNMPPVNIDLVCRSYSFVCTLHHLIIIIVQTLSEDITYKMPVRYNLSSVWVRLGISSQLSIIQYVGLCVFSLPISFVMIERIYIYTLSYYHHQIGSMNYYPLFRARSWNNGMRCMSFYILIDKLYQWLNQWLVAQFWCTLLHHKPLSALILV